MKVLYTNKGLMTESEYLDVKKHDKNIVSYGPANGGPEPTFDFAKHVFVKEELQHSQIAFVDTVPGVVSEEEEEKKEEIQEMEEKACLDEIDLSDLMDTQLSDVKPSSSSKEKKLEKHCEQCGSPLDPGGYCVSGCDDEDAMATFYEAELTDKEMPLDHMQSLKDALGSLDRSVVKEYDTESAERQFGTSGAVVITAKDDGHAKDIAKQIEKMTHLRLLVLRKAFKNINKPTYVLAILNDKSEEILDESLEEKAPPGMEDMVLSLKKKFGAKSPRPYQIAWSVYNKKHGKTAKKENKMMKIPMSELRSMIAELVKEAYNRDEDGYMASLTWGQFPPDEILEKALEDGFTMQLQGRDAEVFDEAMEMRGIEPRMALRMMQDVDGFKEVLEALIEYSMQPTELELDADDETRDEIRQRADIAQMLASGIMDVIGIEWI